MADLLGNDHPGLLRAVGVGLAVFSVVVALAGRRPRIRPLDVLAISLADFAWAAGSLALLVGYPDSFGQTGSWLFAGVAVVVAAFGVAQLVGLRRTVVEPTPGLGEYRYCLAVDVEATPEAMWRVLSNLGAISRYLPTLAASSLREVAAGCESGIGVGRVRECVSTRQQHWAEEVTRFDPEAREFDVRFLADEPGFPFPMRVMHGGWKVLALPDRRSRVIVWWSLTPKVPFMGLPVVAFLSASVDRAFPAVIARMAADATGQPLREKPVATLAGVTC
ncbi:MAG: SRPBCC family protein [Kofleriaceae bacterium]